MVTGRTYLFAAVFVAVSMTPITKTNTIADEKRIIGWLEKVYLPKYGFVITTKMDTGAKNSSIHAVDFEYAAHKGEREGSRIRFKTTDMEGTSRVVEADLIRHVRIRRAGGRTRSRPEIELEICIGGKRKRIRVNLADRGEMNYRMILGRTALEGDFIVDVSRKYTVKGDCQPGEP
jgi:hypothetical protein